jgi:hypothetical protein
MNMENFKNNLAQLKLYIDNVQKAAEEIQTLQKMYELGSINYSAFTSYPSGSIPYDLDKSDLNRGLQIFSDSRGEILPFSGSNLNDAYHAMVSGATASFSELRGTATSTSDQSKWKSDQLSEIDRFQAKWKIADQISAKMKSLGLIDLATEFDEMCELGAKFKSGIVDHSSFGIKMRNVLEHFKGFLKKAAQLALNQKPSKDKELSWPKMAEAIVKNPKSTVQLTNFVTLGRGWTNIHRDLSDLLKSYSVADKEKLNSIYSEELLLIEAFLSSVNETKLAAAI